MTSQLIYGLVTGILFGFFLQRDHVLRYDKQIGALRLMDMTILKFMLTAIFVGSVTCLSAIGHRPELGADQRGHHHQGGGDTDHHDSQRREFAPQSVFGKA